MKVPLYKRLLSYLHPVWIKGAKETDVNPELELLLSKGHWQLATSDAIYSDGDKYTPLLTAYKALKRELPHVKNVLVLGAALGSAVDIVRTMGYHPDFTLVDNDPLVLEWAKELMPPYDGDLKMKQGDAMYYLNTDNNKYDLLIVDVFKGRVVPDFITTKSFMQNCHLHINAGGNFVLNYIIGEDEQWSNFKKVLDEVFPKNTVIKNGINRVIVATV